MRYWFKNNIDLFVLYIETHGYKLYKCDCLAKTVPERVSLAFIKEYFFSTFELNGAAMFEYILLRRGVFDEIIGVKSMTIKVETSVSDDILVYGYSDGGVIVVTNRNYIFHESGLIADWWGLEDTRFP